MVSSFSKGARSLLEINPWYPIKKLLRYQILKTKYLREEMSQSHERFEKVESEKKRTIVNNMSTTQTISNYNVVLIMILKVKQSTST